MTPRQQTFFDETMRQTAEQATWWAKGLQRELDEAQAEIEHLRRGLQAQAAEHTQLQAACEAETLRLRRRIQELEGRTTLRTLEMALKLENMALQWRIQELEAAQHRPAGDRTMLVKALTRLAAECHPDRWQGSPVAEECVKAVLRLRDSLNRVQERS